MIGSSVRLTVLETDAIVALQKLAKTWPKSLWLFSASGTLGIHKKANGVRMMFPPGGDGYGGGVDPAYRVATVDIENDGGDY